MITREPLARTIARHYDARDTVACFLLAALRQLEAAGLTLFYSEDLDAYDAINRTLRGRWFATMPMFDPNLYPNGDRFWIGAFSGNELVFIVAERLYLWPDTDLKHEFESLALYYEEPEAKALANETCRCTAPSASSISGRVDFSGGFWIDHDWRNNKGIRGMAEIGPRLSRALGLLKWQPHYNVGVIDRPLVEKGTADRHGYKRVEFSVLWTGNHYGIDYDMALVWADTAELVRDFASLMCLEDTVRVPRANPSLGLVSRN